ncbi:Metalloendoproteinase 1 [Hibiscus syriacus]|uniref:Metalloendoproteinase 1 n=1 Tax=Hibiscus syriacus TaxID=106335 RepID=A0A6A2WU17_HIBSY|nr:Metalloendoproteinase 1 [Hibiscus syriacus]
MLTSVKLLMGQVPTHLRHGDGAPFDGSGGVLAHAFAPQDGRFQYDAEENWSRNPTRSQVVLESVAVHEIGHVLGLGHSQDGNAIMFPSFQVGNTKKNLGQDDINGLHALYGY